MMKASNLRRVTTQVPWRRLYRLVAAWWATETAGTCRRSLGSEYEEEKQTKF